MLHLALSSNEDNLVLIEKLLTQMYENSHIERKDKGISVQKSGEKLYFAIFKNEAVTSDDISFAVRKQKDCQVYILGSTFTENAVKLALIFKIELWDSYKVYKELKQHDLLPDKYICGEKFKRKYKELLKLRFKRSMYKGYLLSGIMLLALSYLTFYPVYYIVSGCILLTVSAVVRFWGKA
jgi:hypothetical protein